MTLLNALVNDRKHGKLTRVRMIRLRSALLRARKSINLDTGDQPPDRAHSPELYPSRGKLQVDDQIIVDRCRSDTGRRNSPLFSH